MSPPGRKGQSSFEFVVIIGILFIMIIGAFSFVQSRTYSALKDRNDVLIEGVANVIESELGLAATVDGDYYREFTLPLFVEGVNYTVSSSGPSDIQITTDDSSYILLLGSNVTGGVLKGKNVIVKNSKGTFVNTCDAGSKSRECTSASDCDDANPATIDSCSYYCICEHSYTGLDATCVFDSLPASIGSGKSVGVTVIMNNTGTVNWDSSGLNYVYLAQTGANATGLFTPANATLEVSTVSVGQTAQFDFTFTAPSETGSYNLRYRMYKEGIGFFGGECGPKNIDVI